MKRRLLSVLLLAAALVLAVMPLRASADASVANHGWAFLRWWLVSAAFLLTAVAIQRRMAAVILAFVVYSAVWLAHPVCDPISVAQVPQLETVLSLEEPAQRGEPFRKLNGGWYQCKSWLARQLFF
jgi:hypothetical protein